MAAELLGLEVSVRGFVEPIRETPSETGDFDLLYREQFDRVRRFVLGLTGQEALAEDIAQETLLRAYTHMSQFDLSRPLWPWLKCVATRLVIDRSRTAKRETLDPDPLVETACDEIDETAARQLLHEALRALPVRQRAALALRYLDDWKSAEVAAAMGLSRTAVEQLLLRARRSFSMEYLRLGGEPATRLRVSLWPLFALAGWLRDRAARLRQLIVDSGGTSLSLAADGVSNVVVAVAVSGVLFAGSVAMAAPASSSPGVAHVEHGRRAHEEALRLPARTTAASRGVDVAPAVPAKAATERTRTAAAEAPAVRREVDVVATAPVAQAPAGGVAQTARERDADTFTFEGGERAEVGEAFAEGNVEFSSECGDGTLGTTACAAYDAIEATAQP